ncbi:Arylsulfotransferase [Cronobacter condimenti 1330]|uniref:Arylsulfotransferase n=1 Tax=Cronobacter condimenti 1330 TaxID=1073999 RepID=K7ZZE4_9ENTR|nr:aryl-sulfate sulfotransferase [Cronobacter condimenti]ALB63236.1 arylsulfotransferase [Cronobacter condimenti 1330]CCJ72153.1 Arylsulfotransferase [Cronobacter condimenti 1330]
MTVVHVQTELAPANNQLAAYVYFRSDTPVTFTYTVAGRTTSPGSIDFTYTLDRWVTNTQSLIKVPVIGLYANYANQVRIIFTEQNGNVAYDSTLVISTENQTYRDATIFHLDIEQTDPQRFTTVWGNSWLMTTFCDGYDRNGDLRCYYEAPYRNQMLKTHDGYFYIGSDEDEHWYARRFYKIDILGNPVLEYELRDENGNRYTNTHDLTWDTAGNLYMIASDYPDRSTATMRDDAWILKFDDSTGKMLWRKNFTTAFDSSNILNNSGANDVHFNSLSHIPESANNSEAIIVHSRTASVTLGISPDDGHILWSIDTGKYNPDVPAYETVPRLDTSGIQESDNGAHTVFVTQNSYFNDFNDISTGKFVLSLFNNRSCADANAKAVVRPINEAATVTPYRALPIQVLFYAVDLAASTVKQVGTVITFPQARVPQITDFMGAVFDYGNYYTVYTNLARSFFITDATGNVIATVYDVICTLDGYPEFPGQCYRARLFSQNELQSLVTTAFTLA